MGLTFNEMFALSCLLPFNKDDFDVRGFLSPSYAVQLTKIYWLPFGLPVGESTVLQLFRTTLLSKNLVARHGYSRNKVYGITTKGRLELLEALAEAIKQPKSITDVLVVAFYIKHVKEALGVLPADIESVRLIALKSDFLVRGGFKQQDLVSNMLTTLKKSLQD